MGEVEEVQEKVNTDMEVMKVQMATMMEAMMSIMEANAVAVAQPNWCATCRKRVGLTGFKCRCGVTFCRAHRYPGKHACGFD